MKAVSDPTKADESSVPCAQQLLDFADAAIARLEPEMQSARAALIEAVGVNGMVDAAGVVGNRERMNRVTAAAGLELDPPLQILSAGIRDELELHDLPSSKGVKRPGAFSKLVAQIAIPLAARFSSFRNR